MRGVTIVLTGPGTTEQREYDVPDPAPGGMVLEMLRANVCGSEVHILKGDHPRIRPGCVLGHEGVGRIARLGAGVTTDSAGEPLQEGDRVVATYFGECRHCPECGRGDRHLCRNAYARWAIPADEAPHFAGTFGTHWVLNGDEAVYKVPDAVSSRAVSSANCALSQMVHAMARGDVRRGDTVLVLGAGGLGLCAAALVSAAGAHAVVAEVTPARLPKALAFGAASTVDLSGAPDAAARVALLREATGGGADVVLEVTGVPSAFAEGVQSARNGGRFLGVGNISPNRFAELDPGAFTRSGMTMTAVLRYPTWMLSRAVDFIASTPQLPWDDLVDADFGLDQVDAALAAAADRSVTRAGILVTGS